MTSVFQASVPKTPATPVQLFRQSSYPVQQQQQSPAPVRPNTTDDYEKWYTELTPNNRMVLALRSTIDEEVTWALERLCRLSRNEHFALSSIPGLIDALFEWPEWFVGGGALECAQVGSLFSLTPELESKKRHALESMFILRNASIYEVNATEFARYERTRTLVLLGLHRLSPEVDANAEFLLYVIELLQSLSVSLILAPPTVPYLANPLPPLHHIAERSSNRALIVASLSTLTLLLSNPANSAHLASSISALTAAIRYLPLFTSDRELSETCLNYLYCYLAHPPHLKDFLLHPELSATLKLLSLILKSEQVEQDVVVPIGEPTHTAPTIEQNVKTRELTAAESERLLFMTEPERCLEWLKIMYVGNPEAETTQVDLWNLYRTTFSRPGHAPILQAHDVIKNASAVFKEATAMVLTGPQQRFVVRGIERTLDKSGTERFRCCWNRSQCEQDKPFSTTAELYDHVLSTHVDPVAEPRISCSWASCSHPPVTKAVARGHVLTHLPPSQPPPKHPGQPESIMLPYQGFLHPVPDPTQRPPPPPRQSELTYKVPIRDPPSNALTALLCIRVLFRASFASSDAAPRVDEDHFGFPGLIEDTGDEGEEERHAETDLEKEGGRRGRKAFIGIRHLLEEVRIQDETLMGWVTEMVEAGITGTT